MRLVSCNINQKYSNNILQIEVREEETYWLLQGISWCPYHINILSTRRMIGWLARRKNKWDWASTTMQPGTVARGTTLLYCPCTKIENIHRKKYRAVRYTGYVHHYKHNLFNYVFPICNSSKTSSFTIKLGAIYFSIFTRVTIHSSWFSFNPARRLFCVCSNDAAKIDFEYDFCLESRFQYHTPMQCSFNKCIWRSLLTLLPALELNKHRPL